jgi:putative MATE family efflux protein
MSPEEPPRCPHGSLPVVRRPVRAYPRLGQLDRRVVALAVPAFLALVVEPLFLLADTAIVGHLGTTELAAMAIASVVLRASVGLWIFLAYGTTAAVARQVGAGDPRRAVQQGVDGLWLAVGLGLVGGLGGAAATPAVVAAFGPAPDVAAAATDYLLVSWIGLVPMLVVLAATGVLRGFSDARTPLKAAVAANLANIALSYVLVYPVGLGIVGSAAGTVLAQTGMAAYLTLHVVRRARGHGVGAAPRLTGVRRAARAGGSLVIRTLTLQGVLLTTTWSIAGLGSVATATHQIAMALWTFLAYALDAVAIAAQTITGEALGAGDLAGTRALTDRLIRIGLLSGVLTGVLLALSATVLGTLFTDDPRVIDLLAPVLLVAAAFQPLAGVVFVLDGVLIGAGDGPYLAWAGAVVLLVSGPAVVITADLAAERAAAAAWVWLAFGVAFVGTRAIALIHRARGTRWMVTGAPA